MTSRDQVDTSTWRLIHSLHDSSCKSADIRFLTIIGIAIHVHVEFSFVRAVLLKVLIELQPENICDMTAYLQVCFL